MPVRDAANRIFTLAVLGALCFSAVALALAPLLMPGDYSWTANGTSESAAQGLEGAWLARFGFLLLGFAVFAIAGRMRPPWPTAAVMLHRAFGTLMIAAAAFSTRSWRETAAYDAVEDLLHSIAASAMGFAFAFGVIAVAVRRIGRHSRVLDAVAVIASVALPAGMAIWTEAAGVLQRMMFLVAYVWYARESLALVHDRPSATS